MDFRNHNTCTYTHKHEHTHKHKHTHTSASLFGSELEPDPLDWAAGSKGFGRLEEGIIE